MTGAAAEAREPLPGPAASPEAPTANGRRGWGAGDLRAVALALALGLGLFLPRLGAEILRHPLEAKYALAAREMLRGGPLLVAHLFGQLYPDKPPLYFWATAALGWVRGGRIDELTARLPAAVAALGGLVVVYALGRELADRRTGLLAACVLATSNLFFWYARQGHPDQLLTTFVALACLGLWQALRPEARRPRAWAAVAYAAMALGVLSKGLLGLAVPLLAGAGYLAWTGPWRALPRRLRLGPGLALFGAITLAWYGAAVARHGQGYLYETLVRQHLVRYARTWAHPEPWYYYLGEFPAGFFPWVLFLPGALWLAGRAGRGPDPAAPADGGARERRVAGEVGPAPAEAGTSRPASLPARASPGPGPTAAALRFPAAWFVAGFVFFSLSSAKRGAYLLPLYPAAALLVGALWARALAAGARPRALGAPLGLLAGAGGLLALGLAVMPRRLIPGRMVDTLVPAEPRALAAVVALLLLGAAAVWLPWRRGHPALAFGALVGVLGCLLLTAAVVRAPQYGARYPVRELVARIRAAAPGDGPLLSLLHDYDFIVALYLDRPLRPLARPEDLPRAAAAGPRLALLDNDDRHLLGAPGVRLLAEGRLGPKRVMLVGLDPPRR